MLNASQKRMKRPPLSDASTSTHPASTLGWLASKGVPTLFRDFDKTYVSIPRLLHFLALAYVLSVIPRFRDLSESRAVAPLALLGRHALPVFATGTILSFAVRAAKEVVETPSSLLDAGLILAGVAVMLALAATLDLSRRAATSPVRAV